MNCFTPLSLLSCLLLSAAAGPVVTFADPFILLHEGTYYAYGTHADHGIACAVSTDLMQWRMAGNASEGLALHMNDAYGEKWFWAPEVYRHKGKFYMLYTGDVHACIAVSDSPLGPFVQQEKRPYFLDETTLDNTLCFDAEGTPYMFYVRTNDGNNIWSVQLTDDLLAAKEETMRYCLRADKPWERVRAKVVEGPFVLRCNDKYLLTYSANDYQSPMYGVGFATSNSLGGLWKKHDKNPVLQRRNGLVGLGHHSFFRDRDGRLRIVFHAHASEQAVHPRFMVISEAFLSSDGVLSISDDFLIPQLATE